MRDPTDLEITGVVTFAEGNDGLPKILIETPWSSAEIYPHGAHVTGFQKNGEDPLLFLSKSSEFLSAKPIRGGVPIIFPWFGPREGLPAHGFARTVAWQLTDRSVRPDGSVDLYFRMPAIGFSEVDRIYSDTTATVEIVDPGLNRTIRVEKSGSQSTVVWNPWIGKSQTMADFGDDEYLQMVCVESGNVGANKITLPPGGLAVLKVVVSSAEIN